MVGWNHYGAFKPKPCIVCGKEFKPNSSPHKFCSESCKGRWKYITGTETTETQYNKISGNWAKYFNRLTCGKGRELQITKEELLEMRIKQNGLCALSGVEMTCKLEKGIKCWTNASIDRILPGGYYTPDNIQLVCAAVNVFRNQIPLAEYIEWCRRVAEHNGKK